MALNLSILDHSKWPALLKVARLDRPIGSLLLLWPTLAALWIAAEGTPSLHLLIVFSLGTLLTRSAGCVVNDLADQKLDGHVKRTALRPFFTDPTARGRGLGQKIIQHIEGTARDLGLSQLKLETGSLLHDAHHLYEREGFVLCGPFGAYEPAEFSVFMCKDLTKV